MSGNIVHYLAPNSRLPTDVNFEIYTSVSSTPIHVGAHKCFLADASTVFEEMFYREKKPDVGGGGNVTVRVDNIGEAVFRMFLKHLYGEKVEVGELSIFSALEMSELVEKYQIKDLGEELANSVKSQHVDKENVLKVVEMLKKLTIPSKAKVGVEMMVADYLQVNYGRSVFKLATFLTENSVDGEIICFLMEMITKVGWVDIEEKEKPNAYDEKKLLCRYLAFTSFPEDQADKIVEKFIEDDVSVDLKAAE